MIRIEAPHFCAGCGIEHGRVTWAAPILAYMVGWTEGRVLAYALRKGWKAERIA
jgi:hypothetical protein